MAISLTEEPRVYAIVTMLIAFTFLLLQYNPQIALVFISLGLTDYVILSSFNGFAFPLFKKSFNWLEVISGAVVGYAVLIVTSAFIGASFFSVEGIVFNLSSIGTMFDSVLGFMSSQINLFATSRAVEFIVYGILVPIVETGFFFGGLLEVMAKVFKVQLKARRFSDAIVDVRVWTLFLTIAAVFASYHWGVKLGADIALFNFAMVQVFIFGLISCWLVMYSRSLSEATGMHILANSLAMLRRLGVI